MYQHRFIRGKKGITLMKNNKLGKTVCVSVCMYLCVGSRGKQCMETVLLHSSPGNQKVLVKKIKSIRFKKTQGELILFYFLPPKKMLQKTHKILLSASVFARVSARFNYL